MKPIYSWITGILTVLVVISGVSVSFVFNKDTVDLYRDGVKIASERWEVHAERTYINKDSWYDRNVKCPRLLSEGGRETATRCYYAPGTYESLSRSLINTKITERNGAVFKDVPYYAYGTRGSYAGVLQEAFVFENPTSQFEDFPAEYSALWDPRDTRSYQLVWRVTNLDSEYSDGVYNACEYTFGYVKIDLRQSCEVLDRVEIKGDSFKAYFEPHRGAQVIMPIMYDPPLVIPSSKLGTQSKMLLTSDDPLYESYYSKELDKIMTNEEAYCISNKDGKLLKIKSSTVTDDEVIWKDKDCEQGSLRVGSASDIYTNLSVLVFEDEFGNQVFGAFMNTTTGEYLDWDLWANSTTGKFGGNDSYLNGEYANFTIHLWSTNLSFRYNPGVAFGRYQIKDNDICGVENASCTYSINNTENLSEAFIYAYSNTTDPIIEVIQDASSFWTVNATANPNNETHININDSSIITYLTGKSVELEIVNFSVYDWGTQKNNATSNGSVFVNETCGNLQSCFFFNGSSGFIQTINATSITGAENRTLSFWARTADNSSTQFPVVFGSESNAESFGARFNSNGSIDFYGYGTADWDTGFSTDTNLHHYIIDYNGTHVGFYKNSTLAPNGFYEVTLNTGSTSNLPLTIGESSNGSSGHSWNGSIGEVILFNRVLSGEERTKLSEGLLGIFNQKGNVTLLAQDVTNQSHNKVNVTLVYKDFNGSGSVYVQGWNVSDGYIGGDELMLHFPLDSNSSDLSGSGLEGVGKGIFGNESGEINNSFAFNATGGEIEISGTKPLGSDNITYSIWVYPNESKAMKIIADNTHNYAISGVIVTTNSDLSVSFYTGNMNADGNVLSGGVLNVGKWNHIVTAVNNGSKRIYVNGELVASNMWNGSLAWIGGSHETRLGNSLVSRYSRSSWNGSLDDFMVWNESLSGDEIRRIYNAGLANANEGNSATIKDATLTEIYEWVNRTYHPSAYWNLDNNSMDISGNDYNGTFNGDPTQIDGKINTSYHFDGVGDYVELNTPFTVFGTNNFTLSFWVNSNLDSNQIFFGRYRFRSYGTSEFRTNIGPTLASLSVNGYGNSIIDLSTAAPTPGAGTELNEWVHFVFTCVRNGTGGGAYYKNGIRIPLSTNECNPNDINETDSLRIARYTNLYANGSVDELLIINESLSAEKIKQLYLVGGKRLGIIENLTIDQNKEKQIFTVEMDSGINQSFSPVFYGDLFWESYFEEGAVPPLVNTCTIPTNQNHLIECSDLCNITEDVDAGNYSLTVNGSGTLRVLANLTVGKVQMTHRNQCEIIIRKEIGSIK